MLLLFVNSLSFKDTLKRKRNDLVNHHMISMFRIVIPIKLIYVSTCYVYPGIKGNYDENSPVLPINNYAWSKLGGESSVKLYKNSLILRTSATEKPFVHKRAFYDFKTNFIFHEDLVPGIIKVLNLKGILNIGGKSQSVFKFAKRFNPKIKKISARRLLGKKARINITMNINKFKNYS